MCTGIEIALLAAATAASAGGAAISANEASNNAGRISAARNRELSATLQKTRQMSKESRSIFDQRADEIQPEKLAKTQEDVTGDRTEGLTSAVETATPADAPLSGSAPEVVKSEVANRMKEAMESGITRAKALGKLGGYGDLWTEQGFQNNDASRNIGVQQNLISGRMGLLPYKQQLAEIRASQAPSIWGPVLQGAGSVLGSAVGGGKFGGGGAPPAPGWSGDWSNLPDGSILMGPKFG